MTEGPKAPGKDNEARNAARRARLRGQQKRLMQPDAVGPREAARLQARAESKKDLTARRLAQAELVGLKKGVHFGYGVEIYKFLKMLPGGKVYGLLVETKQEERKSLIGLLRASLDPLEIEVDRIFVPEPDSSQEHPENE